MNRIKRKTTAVASEASARVPSVTKSSIDSVWSKGADRLRLKVPPPVLGSIDQVQDSVNSAGSIGLQKRTDTSDKSSGGESDIHNKEYRTEYDSSRDRGTSSEQVYNKVLFQHKLAKNVKSLLRNSTSQFYFAILDELNQFVGSTNTRSSS